MWIFPGIFFCCPFVEKDILKPTTDPLLIFSKNSENALIDLLMALLELFSLQINFLPLDGLLLDLRWVR